MLTPEASWLSIRPTDFLAAAESGSRAAQENQRLGLQTMALLQRGAESAADRQQRELDRRAQLSLEGDRLKRGEFESDRDYAERMKQFGLAERKQTWEETKLGMPKYFHDAKGGVYGIDPLTGQLNVLQKPTAATGRAGTISVPIPTGGTTPGRITIPENDPRIAAWRSLQPTVQTIPSRSRAAWYNLGLMPPTAATTVTNLPPSLVDYLRTNAPSATNLPVSEDMSGEDLEQPTEMAGPQLRVLSIE